MVDAVLLDIDGVLTVSWSPLDGAVETIRWLQDRGINFRLVTNSSSKSRRNEGEIGEDLEGIDSADSRSAGVVLLGGAGPRIGHNDLNDVPVVALHRNARWQTSERKPHTPSWWGTTSVLMSSELRTPGSPASSCEPANSVRRISKAALVIFPLSSRAWRHLGDSGPELCETLSEGGTDRCRDGALPANLPPS